MFLYGGFFFFRSPLGLFAMEGARGCYVVFGPQFIFCIGVDIVLALVLYLRSLISLWVGWGGIYLPLQVLP